jgi:hypothetical protein
VTTTLGAEARGLLAMEATVIMAVLEAGVHLVEVMAVEGDVVVVGRTPADVTSNLNHPWALRNIIKLGVPCHSQPCSRQGPFKTRFRLAILSQPGWPPAGDERSPTAGCGRPSTSAGGRV